MSRNFTADVDTQREYFNATYFNNSGQNQIAKYDTTLLKPFFNDPDKWKLSINRMRVPLSGIPLTKNNIPFEQWQVGLGYFNGTQQQVEYAYVEQVNQKTVSEPIYLNISSDYNLQNATIYPVAEVLEQIPISNINYDILPVSESSNGKNTFYILDNDGVTVNVYQDYSNTVVATLANPTPIVGKTFNSLVGFCTDLSGNFYYCYYNTLDGSSPTAYYLNIQAFNRTSATTWTLGLNYNFSPSYVYDSLGTVDTMFVYNGVLYVYVNYSQPGSYYFTWNLGTAGIAGDGPESTNKWVGLADSTWIYRTNSSGTFTTSNGLIFNYTFSNVYSDRFLGLDPNGNVLLHRIDSNGNEIGYQAFNPITGRVVYSFTPANGSYSLLNSDSQFVNVESGPVDIFTYQTFLNQINSAFESAFQNIKTVLGSTYSPTQAPRIIYNASTKLFSVICEGVYTQTDSSGNQEFQILLNQTLWNQFFFPSYDLQLSGTTYKELIVQNNGINSIQGTGSSTLPQFVYVQQEDSTIYAFYDLVRIIVGTTRIPVSGDGEGKTFTNNGTASNSSINMITDIVPDTTTLTPGSILIYIPAGILRWYNLYAQQPFDKIDLSLQYETKDGNIYPIIIPNGEFFSVKLEFKKGQGDF